MNNGPALIYLALVLTYPLAYSLWLSFHHFDLAGWGPYAGLANYRELFRSADFRDSLSVTLRFSGMSLFLLMFLGLSGALVLNGEFPFRGIVRASIFLPWAIPPVVNGLMWSWLTNGSVGALNGVLKALHLIEDYRAWLSTPASALGIIVAAHVWNNLPFVIVVLLAALQAVPPELYEAARVDGANWFRAFRYVTWPWLITPFIVCVTWQGMHALRAFDAVYVLTNGGPAGTTQVLAWVAYNTGFVNGKFGLAAAYSYVIAGITLFFILSFIRVIMKEGRGET